MNRMVLDLINRLSCAANDIEKRINGLLDSSVKVAELATKNELKSWNSLITQAEHMVKEFGDEVSDETDQLEDALTGLRAMVEEIKQEIANPRSNVVGKPNEEEGSCYEPDEIRMMDDELERETERQNKLARQAGIILPTSELDLMIGNNVEL